MPNLTNGIGCLPFSRNDVTFDISNLGDRNYYLIAFVDLENNERHDAQEPFLVFEGRSAAPGDALNGHSTRSDVDFIFGDEGLAATPTPTDTPPTGPTLTPTPTAEATATAPAPTATTTPGVAGDCDGDGTVGVDELVRAVGIALESLPLSACPSADRDGDGVVRIEELIAALNAALA